MGGLKKIKQLVSFYKYSLCILMSLVLLLNSCSKKTNNPTPVPPPPVPIPALNAEVTILANDINQTIRGFGCATVFNPPATTPVTSEEFGRLFGSADGQVGLNILRIRVASDDAWRNTELNYAREAILRGARIIASPWSPPARMKTNNNIIGGKLITDSSAAYAKYLNDFANYMASNGAPLYAISVQNEPDISVTYESCDWTSDEMRLFLKNYGNLITSTRVIAPESFNNNQTYVNAILADNGAAVNMSIVGGHIYGAGIAENLLAKTKVKEVWMTEHLDSDTTYTANLNTAVEIHNCLTIANFNAYIWWYGKRFYGPIGQDGLVTKRGIIMSQFARFIQPGSTRLGTTVNTQSVALISAYKSGTKKIIVAVNTGAAEVNQKITIQDAGMVETMPFVTTASKNAEQGAKITVSGNSFTYKLPAYSVTTFVEQ
jgi:glucuronoarabinoxylan endo-1,4-beta-xylanase